MSRGPGRIQRAILAAVNAPDAAASYEPTFDYERPGAVGAPYRVIFEALYGTRLPTRAQRHSVLRAIRTLESRGEVVTGARRVCPDASRVVNAAPCPYCHAPYWHPPIPIVQRPRTSTEEMQHAQRVAVATRRPWSQAVPGSRQCQALALAG